MTDSHKKIKILFRHRSMEMGGVEKVMLSLLQNLNPEKYDLNGRLLPASGAVEVTASPIEYLTPVPKIGLLKPVIKPVIKPITKPITKSVENVTTAILRKKLIKQVPVNKKISDVVNAAIYQTEKVAEKAASKAEKASSKVVDKRFLQPTTFNHVPKITYKNPNISFKMPYHVKK